MIDGQRQREALTAAERALTRLEQGRWDEAVEAADTALRLDQAGAFAELPVAVSRVADFGRAGEEVPAAAWASLKTAVGPGPLSVRVERLAS